MKSIIHTARLFGGSASEATVTTGLSLMGGFRIEGLSDAAIMDNLRGVLSILTAKPRVSSRKKALWTRTDIRVSPDDKTADGRCYHLPIAIGFLAATGLLRADDLDEFLVVGAVDSYGELHGGWDIRPVVALALSLGLKAVIVPSGTVHEPKETDPFGKVTVYFARTLDDAQRILSIPSCREEYLVRH